MPYKVITGTHMVVMDTIARTVVSYEKELQEKGQNIGTATPWRRSVEW